MNNYIQEKLGYFLIILIFGVHLIFIDVLFFKYKNDLLTYNQQNFKNNNDILLHNIDELLNSRIKNLIISIDNYKNTNFATDNFHDHKVSSKSINNNLIELLVKIIKIQESFETGLLTHNQISEIITLLLEFENKDIKNAINEIKKLKYENFYTFSDLQKSFNKIFYKIYYTNADKLQKFFFRCLIIINKNKHPWKSMLQVNQLMNHKSWYKALELAKKDLLHTMELSDWIRDFEDMIILDTNIKLLHKTLYQIIKKSS